ncbi:hypothetical protein SV7mr_19400 [Stieleria bergensis]|uniref:Uncharacterized protein n=1 Tax=Stieleria bergensis TaxID=2528025 RepID=A0A517STN6_9BACT|nr:hypothetical protein SV7mr_19400 [Planctomycetes bacterium SV_7m_r]
MRATLKEQSDRIHDGSLLFHCFTKSGVHYLAFRRGSGTTVIDTNGNDYGSWLSQESFLKHLKQGDIKPIGVMRRISIRSESSSQ